MEAAGHEPDAERLELVEQRDEVLQAPPQAVQPPDDDGIHRPALGVPDQAIQGRAALAGPAPHFVNTAGAS